MGFIGSLTKEEIIKAYAAHVSSGKVDFYELIGLDFVLGHRVGPWMTDTPKEDHEGPEIRLLNCHCNGGVFNLGHRHPDVVNVLAKAIHELDIGNHHLISEQRAVLA
ncbi:MAG: aspartate aminotransferase family protein, partial [Candidatus Hodarchaeales archaeon]